MRKTSDQKNTEHTSNDRIRLITLGYCYFLNMGYIYRTMIEKTTEKNKLRW